MTGALTQMTGESTNPYAYVLLEARKSARHGLLRAVAVAEPHGDADGWDAKAVLAHVIGWDEELLAAMEHRWAGGPPRVWPHAMADWNTPNAAAVEWRRDRSLEQLMEEEAALSRRIEEIVKGLEFSDLFEHWRTHFGTQNESLADILMEWAGHDYEHAWEILGRLPG